MEELLRRSFRPEFLNRLDEIVFYKPLTKDDIGHILDLMLAELNGRLAERQLSCRLTDAARQQVLTEGYDPVYGARPLRRYLQQNVETLIGRRIVEGNLHAGDVLTIDAKDGTLSVEAAPKD